MRKTCLIVVVVFLLLGCSDQEQPGPASGPGGAAATAEGAASDQGGSVSTDPKSVGEAIAKEAISEFDKVVAECAEVLAGKPEEAVVLPKLQAIYESYRPRMTALADRRKALTDPREKGGFYSYMGENRGKAVFRMDQALGTYVAHYRMMAPGPKVVEFLTTKVVELIEIAHNK